MNYLKKYVREPGDLPPAVRLPRFEGPEYEVDRILDSKRISGKQHYLVKWKGFGVKDASWEPAKNLERAKERIANFKRKEK
mmetsp:Transcript_13436/g.26597  ORF Transcript_13436/g.26597 Transcript_13436/m.26597 type:complete len:81 (-) Transcript_13436:249-491(-)